MRRSLIILPAILVAIFILLSKIDRSDYHLEKRLWLYRDQFAQIEQNPASISESQFNDLAMQYENLISKYPKSTLLPRIYMQLGKVYAVRGDYEGARYNYLEILKRFPNQKENAAAALWEIGSIYIKEGKKDQAIQSYVQIVHDYPDTKVGLNTPIHLVNLYFQFNKKEEAVKAIRDAEVFYKRIILNNPGSSIGFYAKGFLARVYLVEKQWVDAFDLFKSILLDDAKSPYMNGEIAYGVIISIRRLSVENLKDPHQAVIIYRAFIKKYPQSPLDQYLKETIKSLQEGDEI